MGYFVGDELSNGAYCEVTAGCVSIWSKGGVSILRLNEEDAFKLMQALGMFIGCENLEDRFGEWVKKQDSGNDEHPSVLQPATPSDPA